jgi:hypothetical protein
VSEASAFTGQIDCSGLSVADLTGIETFTSLTRLLCSDNSLNTLDLSQNIALIWLFCYNNSLTSLDLSTNTALTRLWCYNNSLNTLDVSQSTGLAWLYCNDNYLSSLDVSNSALTQFNCMNNSLTSLNVSNGNNMNITTSNFSAVNNPNLTCIEVDDVAWSTTNWTNIDATASFSNNCGTVGINESNIKTMNIAPNPAKDVLNISTLETVEQVTIYSISGSLVKNINQNINQINVEDLTEGMYILVIKTENGITRNRFIKE